MSTLLRPIGRLFGPLWIPLMVLVLLVGACGTSDQTDQAEPTTDTTGSTSIDQSTSTSDSTSTSTTTTSSTSTSSTTTRTSDPPVTEPQVTKVKVFFNDDDPDECASVEGWTRSVPAGADPLRHAFDELVKGPRSSEVSAGAFSFFSRATAGMVRSTTTDGDVLVVDFDDFRAVRGMSNAGTSCGSGALLGQLDATAFQFAGIDLVRYELEGNCQEFGAFLQTDCIEVRRADWEAAVAAQLPGEPFDGILPPRAVLGVVGVEADDVLNVRALPGARQTIVDTLEPLAMGLRSTGRERLVGARPSVWYEINTGETIGWVNSRYVAPLAGTVDVTSEVVSAIGEIPTAETATQIGDIVVEARTRFVDGDLSVVIVDGPHRGDLNELTYDVIGFHDDSVRGERLHLFITPPEVADGPMTLKSVEVTFICARGAGQGELCP